MSRHALRRPKKPTPRRFAGFVLNVVAGVLACVLCDAAKEGFGALIHVVCGH